MGLAPRQYLRIWRGGFFVDDDEKTFDEGMKK
jgi:hypothetical protein